MLLYNRKVPKWFIHLSNIMNLYFEASIMSCDICSLLVKSPPVLCPRAIIQAPVNVARFTTFSGEYLSCIYERASASTNLPSASVLVISTV